MAKKDVLALIGVVLIALSIIVVGMLLGKQKSEEFVLYWVYDESISDLNRSGEVALAMQYMGRTISILSEENIDPDKGNFVPIMLSELKSEDRSSNSSHLVLIRKESGPPEVIVFQDNSTVMIKCSNSSDFYAAIGRLILAMWGKYLLEVPPPGKGIDVILVVDPITGEKAYARCWPPNLSKDRAMNVGIVHPDGSPVKDEELVPQILLNGYYIGLKKEGAGPAGFEPATYGLEGRRSIRTELRALFLGLQNQAHGIVGFRLYKAYYGILSRIEVIV